MRQGARVNKAREEFEKAALPHLDSLFNLALRMTRDERDAEDLVQETFLRAYRFFDRYETGTNIRAWLFRILKNNFINRYRTKQRQPETVEFGKIEESYESILEEVDQRFGQDPERAAVGVSIGEAIDRAMALLPAEYRTVCVMALVEEMAYKEIAVALEIPIGTVMSRLHRGRRLLQKHLAETLDRAGTGGGRPGGLTGTGGPGAPGGHGGAR